MKNKLKIIIAALLIISTVLVSCSKSGGEDTDTTAADTTTTAAAGDALVLADGAGTQLKIVYPASASPAEKTAAEDLQRNISDLTGATVKLSDDYIRGDQAHDSSTVEVLVGMTCYAETLAVAEGVAYGDYMIKVSGNKLVVLAYTSEAMSKASGELRNYFSKIIKGNTLAFPKDHEISATVVSELNGTPKFATQSRKISFSNGGDDSYTLSVEQSTKSEYEAYVASLVAGGFKQTQSHTMAGAGANKENLFCAYTNDTLTISVIYVSALKQVSVMIDSVKTNPVLYENAPTAGGELDTVMWQVGIADDSNGMCYIFRLSDGTFLVFDGGFDDDASDSVNKTNGKRIRSILKENAADPNNIVISGWFITHPHTDHIGALVYFINKGYSDIKIEKVFCNLPDSDFVDTVGKDMGAKVSRYRRTLDKLKATGTEFYKVHIGQQFAIADVGIEVMFTYDLLLREGYIEDDNGLSCVFRLTVDGQTIMITGDTTEKAMSSMTGIYGADLKSDILQVPHHGVNGTALFFTYVKPTYAFIPTSGDIYEEGLSKPNMAYIYSGMNQDKVFISHYNTQKLVFPFNGTLVSNTANSNVF